MKKKEYVLNKVTPLNLHYDWKLSNLDKVEKHNCTVFSCFACGGGSSMGYKLAGYNVIGFNEVNPKLTECYITNLNPKYKYIKPIQEFKNRKNFPKALHNLDILDGSPPCSSFSIAGVRERDWGKEKKFKEGQHKQVLDTLFFDFIDLAEILKPKIIVAENVKGLLIGNAKKYLMKIGKQLNNIGYSHTCKLLNASTMGVPQERERVFILAIRNNLLKYVNKDMLDSPIINLQFNLPKIKFKEISDNNDNTCTLNETYINYWELAKEGESVGKFKARKKQSFNSNIHTLVSSGHNYHPIYKRSLNKNELLKISTFPKNYNFLNNDFKFIVGMSVPPIMMAQISNQIKIQWLNKINAIKK